MKHQPTRRNDTKDIHNTGNFTPALYWPFLFTVFRKTRKLTLIRSSEGILLDMLKGTAKVMSADRSVTEVASRLRNVLPCKL